MAKTKIGWDDGLGAGVSAPSDSLETKDDGHRESVNVDVIKGGVEPTPISELRVAVVDDGMHPPKLSRLAEADALEVTRMLTEDREILAELDAINCGADASIDDRLLILAQLGPLSPSLARLGEVSGDGLQMIEEYRAFQRLLGDLEKLATEVKVCDPFGEIPDLTSYELVLLDYYLEGPSKGGERAIQIASSIKAQRGRPDDQQIVLMSSLERVRELRGQFRNDTKIAGSAFAFVGKRDLDESWKIKAHLGMLERARPYAPAFVNYRGALDEALGKAREGLLDIVDDLDIGDYAFLQSHALMNDGHPLGDYVFWLLSSHLMALAFESAEMRERQHALDKLKFVGETFTASEPSTEVANLLHSALVSQNIGPLGAHPLADLDGAFSSFPLVQLGDVFFDAERTMAVVVMSAACDLAFSPVAERQPETETPVMLVPGTTTKLRKGPVNADGITDGIVHRQEVYRIEWTFRNYRSVELGKIEVWLKDHGFDLNNRDRLRPIFALKLQHEFGAHLLRVGPPVLPPMTIPATGKIFVCDPDRNEFYKFEPAELLLTRYKEKTLLRVTPRIAGLLKQACEDLLIRLDAESAATAKANGDPIKTKSQIELDKKIESLSNQVMNDDFWIKLLNGKELNGRGSVKTDNFLGFVLGAEWSDTNKPRVVLEIEENQGKVGSDKLDSPSPLSEGELEVGAVSGAA